MRRSLAQELEALQKQSADKRLYPERMIKHAADHPDSELHKEFEWDDTEAGKEYRLGQARNLIRAYVIVLPQVERRVRGFLSVPTDRDQGGGYRTTPDVLRSSVRRNQMIAEALQTIRDMDSRYSYLTELDPFFTELAKLTDKWCDELGIKPQQAVA